MARHPHTNALSPTVAGAEQSDLTRLLETEARLEETLRRAREEAARLVREAQAAVAARELAQGGELEQAGRRLEAEIVAERVRREGEITEAAQRDAQRYDRVPAERVGELVRYVVDRLIAGAA